jgi:curved DNA-binding protein CbpA
MENYYAVLGVSRSANISTIRESYRRLALRFHPDKNKSESATSDFQRIVKAWEILQDEGKREEYDRDCGIGTNRNSEQHYDDFLRAQRRKEQVNPDVENWSNSTSHDFDNDRTIRRERSRVWKDIAQRDYLSRLNTWTGVRNHLVPLALACCQSIQLLDSRFQNLTNTSDCEAMLQFQKAIDLSRSNGEVMQDPDVVISRLLYARQEFMAKLSQELSNLNHKYRQLVIRLEENQRNFEHEEIDMQQLRIQEALQILGPRHLGPPLLVDVDRRLRAINRWESLSKIGSAQNFSAPSLERLAGEHQCSRCNKLDFHVIPECGPAKCPACGIVVCNECHRDLWLLRKYSEWILSPPGDLEDCFFSLEV